MLEETDRITDIEEGLEEPTFSDTARIPQVGIRNRLLPYLTVAVGLVGCGAAQQIENPNDPLAAQKLAELRGPEGEASDATLNKLGLNFLVRGDVITFNHLRTLFPKWKPNFSGARVQIKYLAGAHLDDADFSRANLYGTVFSGAQLQRAKFNGATLDNIHFDNQANLTDAEFIGATMVQPSFDTANLNGARLFNSTFIAASFAGADLTQVFIDNCKMPEARFVDGAILDYAIILSSDLSHANFSHSSLQNTEFTGTVVVGGHFEHSNLFSAKINGKDFSHADFSFAHMENIEIFDGKFDGTQFVHAQMQYAHLGHKVKMKGANFSDANLQHATFKGIMIRDITKMEVIDSVFDNADLSNFNAEQLNMSGSRFYKAVMYYANLNNVNLTGADFTEADLTDASMPHCKVDGIDESGNVLGKKPGDLTPGQVSAMKVKPY